MRLIDADALAKELMHEGLGYQYNRVINAPTVDAIPVIRCRDCKKYKPCMTVTEYNFCSMTGALVDGQDFCSWAEGKEE